MELNRNQFLFIAIFLALLGMQLRMVSSYVLTSEATRFLAERALASADPVGALAGTTPALPATLPAKVVSPPDWLGWCLLSIGAVLFFHSLTMGKPSG
ncbi:hypothetical protein Pla108_32780 [Botrimarina colliarenosi]|uniref:Uncharacterized protein n=1 Tax=Botrimarina colliarenosi TaxID=2528001 RepID=A0A5C6A9V7_9BACT|nr:hypothetical protein [Botrimarina colliarenosi]TWT96190.1 hypothetical protein Pla108_32780 [Botrimarina colliarenosi]